MRVLVTIGSMSEKKFLRLFKIIEELCEEKILDGEKLVAQVGFDDYNPHNFRAFDFLSDEDFKKSIDKSDLIITHAGTGTVTSCLKRGKKVIIFPRLAQYEEHYDDHQLELAELFTSTNHVLCATNKEELIECIERLNTFIPSEFVSNNQKMNRLILDFIEMK